MKTASAAIVMTLLGVFANTPAIAQSDSYNMRTEQTINTISRVTGYKGQGLKNNDFGNRETTGDLYNNELYQVEGFNSEGERNANDVSIGNADNKSDSADNKDSALGGEAGKNDSGFDIGGSEHDKNQSNSSTDNNNKNENDKTDNVGHSDNKNDSEGSNQSGANDSGDNKNSNDDDDEKPNPEDSSGKPNPDDSGGDALMPANDDDNRGDEHGPGDRMEIHGFVDPSHIVRSIAKESKGNSGQIQDRKVMFDHTAGDGAGAIDPNQAGRGVPSGQSRTDGKLNREDVDNSRITGKGINFSTH